MSETESEMSHYAPVRYLDMVQICSVGRLGTIVKRYPNNVRLIHIRLDYNDKVRRFKRSWFRFWAD